MGRPLRTDASLLEGDPPVRDGFAVLEPPGAGDDDRSVVRLHYVEAGEGPLVLLLHGFPEFWYGWRHQIQRLARAGFRVVAPDLRGYNLSDKPTSVDGYGMATLAADVALLIEALGCDRANVVGHDIGAGVAWAAAMLHPDRVERLAVLNGPHPRRLLEAMRSPRQILRSWYVFLFQIPRLAELALRRHGYALVLSTFRDRRVATGTFTEADLERYAASYAIPGALTGMLRYYRAMVRPRLGAKLAKVTAPTLVLWGEDDPYLGRQLAEPPRAEVPDVRVERLPGATHWLHHEQPERVSELLIEFFREPVHT